MSDLSASCGCDSGVSSCGYRHDCGFNNSCLWILLLLFCCGGNGGFGRSGECGFGNDSCLWIILLLCCCGGFGGGCGC